MSQVLNFACRPKRHTIHKDEFAWERKMVMKFARYRLGLAALVFVAGHSAFAQREPIESVIQRYRAYVQALDSPNAKVRIATMKDYTRHILKRGYRGLPPIDEEDPKQDRTDPEWIAKNLYRQIVGRIRRLAKHAGEAEFKVAFRLSCAYPDLREGDVWGVFFGDLPGEFYPLFDEHLAADIGEEHPEWARALFDDRNDIVAVNAVRALPELSKAKRQEWANDHRSVRRSVYMQDVFLATGYDGLLDKDIALKFLADKSFDVRWQAFSFFTNSRLRARPPTKDLVTRFPRANNQLKWSILLLSTFVDGDLLIPEARELRKDKDPFLRSQALMLLYWRGETITDEETRFGFTHCYRGLKRFWLEEVMKHPGLKDFAKQAQVEVAALGW